MVLLPEIVGVPLCCVVMGDPHVPATVEVRPRRAVIMAVAAAGVLLAGAVVWALVEPHGLPELHNGLTPEVAESFRDGVGPVRPSPTTSRSAGPARSNTASASPSASASAASVAQTGVVSTASYRLSTSWQGGFQIDFKLANPGTSADMWTVRVELPSNAKYDHSWSSEVRVEGNVLIFTPPKWDNGAPKALAPGAEHVFGFIALQPPGEYRLLSCTIGASPCKFTQ